MKKVITGLALMAASASTLADSAYLDRVNQVAGRLGLDAAAVTNVIQAHTGLDSTFVDYQNALAGLYSVDFRSATAQADFAAAYSTVTTTGDAWVAAGSNETSLDMNALINGSGQGADRQVGLFGTDGVLQGGIDTKVGEVNDRVGVVVDALGTTIDGIDFTAGTFNQLTLDRFGALDVAIGDLQNTNNALRGNLSQAEIEAGVDSTANTVGYLTASVSGITSGTATIAVETTDLRDGATGLVTTLATASEISFAELNTLMYQPESNGVAGYQSGPGCLSSSGVFTAGVSQSSCASAQGATYVATGDNASVTFEDLFPPSGD